MGDPATNTARTPAHGVPDISHRVDREDGVRVLCFNLSSARNPRPYVRFDYPNTFDRQRNTETQSVADLYLPSWCRICCKAGRGAWHYPIVTAPLARG